MSPTSRSMLSHCKPASHLLAGSLNYHLEALLYLSFIISTIFQSGANPFFLFSGI